ncbi:MAG TPA: alpha/beta hydrolase [Herpetosiphonaceae bacterium]
MNDRTHTLQYPAIPLWHGSPPRARGATPHDDPSLTPYVPQRETPTGAAIVVCPGGGYHHLAPHEGHDYALWLTLHGITAFVLRYRLGAEGYRHPAMLDDVTRALRLVRARAEEWQLDAARIGVMGSSAGGHLAATLLTRWDAGRADAADPIDRQSSRPDLGILCYPVISMGPVTHEGSRQNLLGDHPSADLVHLLSNELHVTPQTPPCFIWHTWEDPAVKVENSLEFAAALRRHGVPFDLHIYQRGQHGLGLGDGPPFHQAHPWTTTLREWLQIYGFVSAS